MQDFAIRTAPEHIASLRQSSDTINRITRAIRREPRDTWDLQLAKEQAERDLMALEAWAAEQPRG